MAKKIGILLHHGLGDVMMARKLLINCCHFFTNDKLLIIVKSSVEKIFVELLDLKGNHEIIVLGYTGSKLSKLKMIPQFFVLKRYKLDVLLASHSTSNRLGNFFSKMIAAKVSIGPKYGRGYTCTVSKETIHKEDYYLSFLEEYFSFTNVVVGKALSALPVVFDTTEFPKKYNYFLKSDYIVISPGTSPFDTHKRWETNKFSELINIILSNHNQKIIILGSKADVEVMNSVYLKHINDDRVLMVNDLSIKNAMVLIQKSKLLVAACTSALHMAHIVDAHMVSIYGPTNYSVTGPVSLKNRIVRKGYSCSPCFRPSFTGGCNTPKCMMDISVGEVYKACDLSLKNCIIPKYPILNSTEAKYFEL